MPDTLSTFIFDQMDPILDEWEAFARTIPAAGGFSRAALRDHAGDMLKSVAHDLSTAPGGRQHCAKTIVPGAPSPLDAMARRHGEARMADGFTLEETISEYCALRASVLRLWVRLRGDGESMAGDITRFNEAIDQALAESLSRYVDARERQYQLFDALLSSSPDLNYIADMDGRLVYANQAFAAIFQLPPSRLQGASLYELLAPYAPDIALHVAEVIGSLRPHRGELKVNVGRRGRTVYEYLLVPALDGEQRCMAVAGSARDVTDRKAAEDRHRHGANFDRLTRLPNRNMFHESLAREIKHALRSGRALGLLFIDLDGFKAVNDRLGHEAGDQLLKQVARRISARVRETDTVARLGGDEFTVILTDVAQLEAVEHLAAGLLEELARPYRLSAGEAGVSASVGIALYPGDGRSGDELVRNADTAMYAAKNAGRNCYRFFEDGGEETLPPHPARPPPPR